MSTELIEKLGSIYGEIYEISIMVGQLIDRKQYGSIDHFLDIKENLFNDADELLKKLGETPELSQYAELCEKIKEQEAMNINALVQNRDFLKQEMTKGNKKAKLVNAYNNVETKQGNLLDFRQ